MPVFTFERYEQAKKKKKNEGQWSMRELRSDEPRIIRGWIYLVLGQWYWECIIEKRRSITRSPIRGFVTDHCGQKTVLRDNTWRATPTYTIRIRRTGGGVSRGMPHGCPWHALQIAGRFMGESGRPVAQFPYFYGVIVREDPFFRKNGVAGTVSTFFSLSLSLPFLFRLFPLILQFL